MLDDEIIFTLIFIFVPILVLLYGKKPKKKLIKRKNIIYIIFFSYLWSFLNIFIHECGHALAARSFGIIASKLSVGIGAKWFRWGGGGYTKIVFKIFPIFGLTSGIEGKTKIQNIIILASGVLTQFFFLGLVYWLVKKNKKWQENIIGHFVYNYAIKLAFWLTIVLNFPFVLLMSDWTKITKILLNI